MFIFFKCLKKKCFFLKLQRGSNIKADESKIRRFFILCKHNCHFLHCNTKYKCLKENFLLQSQTVKKEDFRTRRSYFYLPSMGMDPPPHIGSTTMSPGWMLASWSMEAQMVARRVVGPKWTMFRLNRLDLFNDSP